MNQQTRTIVFIVASMGILGIWMYLMPSPAAPPAASPAVSSTPMVNALTSLVSSTSASEVSPSISDSRMQATYPLSKIPDRSVTIDTQDYTAIFSNRGALLTSFRLKKYKNRLTNKPYEMVNTDPSRPRPFSITYAPLADLNQRMYQIVEGTSKTLSGVEKTQLVFRFVDSHGTVFEKAFGFTNGSYLIQFDAKVSQTGGGLIPASDLIVAWADTFGPDDNLSTSRVPGYRVATFADGKVVSTESEKKSQQSVEIPGPVTWIALANQFFVAALVPDPSSGEASAKVVRDFNAYNSPTEQNPVATINPNEFGPRPLLVFAGPALRSGESFERKLQVFFGPQDYDLLKKLNLQLENIVNFGFFGFLSVYMLELLKWFYTWTYNWGLAIILLSIAVKLVLWMPTHNSYKSMFMMQQKMKIIQPKMDALKRKYPDDKQKQQQEQMKIYNEAGVNPLGGCLPMLLQTPVFWALYATLEHSIELRGASFLWLHDLSLKDPFYVFPLLMGSTMLLQQKVSGQMANQAAGQQKVMLWLMPGVLTFMSFQWPSGLLVYWVVTNVLSMIQQKIVNTEIKKHQKKEEDQKS